MPCTYYTPEQEAHERGKEYAKLKSELDKATRLLCTVLSEMEKLPGIEIGYFDKELHEWWAEHKKSDRVRLQREAKAEEARKKIIKAEEDRKKKIESIKKKLTKEELALLKGKL